MSIAYYPSLLIPALLSLACSVGAQHRPIDDLTPPVLVAPDTLPAPDSRRCAPVQPRSVSGWRVLSRGCHASDPALPAGRYRPSPGGNSSSDGGSGPLATYVAAPCDGTVAVFSVSDNCLLQRSFTDRSPLHFFDGSGDPVELPWRDLSFRHVAWLGGPIVGFMPGSSFELGDTQRPSALPVMADVRDVASCGSRFAVVGRFALSELGDSLAIGDGETWQVVEDDGRSFGGVTGAAVACGRDGVLYSPFGRGSGRGAVVGVLAVRESGESVTLGCPNDALGLDLTDCASMGVAAPQDYDLALLGRGGVWLLKVDSTWERAGLACESLRSLGLECEEDGPSDVSVYPVGGMATCGDARVVVLIRESLVWLVRNERGTWQVDGGYSVTEGVAGVGQVLGGVVALVGDELRLWECGG